MYHKIGTIPVIDSSCEGSFQDFEALFVNVHTVFTSKACKIVRLVYFISIESGRSLTYDPQAILGIFLRALALEYDQEELLATCSGKWILLVYLTGIFLSAFVENFKFDRSRV